MATFTWIPEYNAEVETKPRVNRIAFGDGYEQRYSDGINTSPRSWSLIFKKLSSDIDDIDDFLLNENGVGSFTWTPPRGLTGKWVCDSWKRTVSDPGYDSLTAVFREVFGE